MYDRVLPPVLCRQIYEDPLGVVRLADPVWAKVAVVAGTRRVFVT